MNNLVHLHRLADIEEPLSSLGDDDDGLRKACPDHQLFVISELPHVLENVLREQLRVARWERGDEREEVTEEAKRGRADGGDGVVEERHDVRDEALEARLVVGEVGESAAQRC